MSSQMHRQGDAAGLPSPFQQLHVDLTRDELKETCYEIFAASCRAVSGIGVVARPKTSLNYVSQASQKTITANATSSIKKALGLRSRTNAEKDQPVTNAKTKKPHTSIDIVKAQMGISDQTDTRIRRALSRTAAGQVGKNVDMMLLPLELLQQIRLADFADVREYQQWQRRQLKVLEAGLLLHPVVKLEQSNNAAQRLRQLLRASSQKTFETGKNSETMQTLRSAATSLVSRTADGKTQEVCHWADGFPFNIHLYQVLLLCLFDRTEETNLIDEVDDIVELFKKSWGILGFNQQFHNVCFMWVLFHQFIVTGQAELDLLKATYTQMEQVAKDAKEIRDPHYIQVLSSVLNAIQTWAEKRLFAYHDTFPDGAPGQMEALLPVALNAARILHEDISHEFRRRRKEEMDVAMTRIDLYVRSSLKSAFAQMMEQADSRRKSFSKKGPVPGLISLASNVLELMKKERDKFSPVLKQWHPLAASLAAATLHSCFSRELKQYLASVSFLSQEVINIVQSVDELEKELVRIAVEVTADSDDGGKGIIREMVPFEAQAAVGDLAKKWINERLVQFREWAERNVKQENWNPEALKDHYAPSVVEIFRLVDETMDEFFGLPVVERSSLLQDLVVGLDKALLYYVTVTKSGCGTKRDLIPKYPPLTRCKDSKLNSSFGSLWKKKERSPVTSKGKAQESGSCKLATESCSICVRINTLHRILTELDVLEKRLSNGWLKESPTLKSSKSKKSLAQLQSQKQVNAVCPKFDQTRTGIQEGISSLCEVLVYHVVFKDLQGEFWEGLYCGSVAQARIGHALQSLETQLALIVGIVTEQLRTRVIMALMRVSFETFLMVLLAGGPSRGFHASDAEMLDEDFIALKDLFKADGEGLPSGTVEKVAAMVTQVLPLFSMDTEDIIQNYKQSVVESHGYQSGRSKLPLPESTGKWGPTDANTLLRILCYRCDQAASKFLKKAYSLPKRN